MKKHLRNYGVLVLVAIILMIPLFQNVYFVGHDTKFHVANVLALEEQMVNGNFWSSILGHIANNFGYGTKLFYPPLAHSVTAILGIVFAALHLDVTVAFRFVHFLTVLLSAFTMYLCAYRFSKNKELAFFSALIYMTCPYLLSDIYTRCAFSESLIFIFVPLIFYGIFSLLEQDVPKFYLAFILGYVGAFLSHLTIMMYFTLFLFAFLLFYHRKTFQKEFLIPFLKATFAVILLILPFLQTLLSHKLFGNYVVFQEGKMAGGIWWAALTLSDYLNSFSKLGANEVRHYLLWIVSLLFFLTLLFSKKISFPKYSKGVFLFTGIAFFLSSVAFPWDIMPSFFRMIQFPWRLVLFVDFGVSLMAPFCLTIPKNIPKIVLFLLFIGIVFSSYQSIAFASQETIDVSNIEWNDGMGWQREYLPVNTYNNLHYFSEREEDILVKDGNSAQILILDNEVPNMTFSVEKGEGEVTIELPRLFYFGYQLKHDGQILPVYENSKGFLETKVRDAGIYTLTYTGTSCQRIARGISLVTFLILCFRLISKKKSRKASS